MEKDINNEKVIVSKNLPLFKFKTYYTLDSYLFMSKRKIKNMVNIYWILTIANVFLILLFLFLNLVLMYILIGIEVLITFLLILVFYNSKKMKKRIQLNDDLDKTLEITIFDDHIYIKVISKYGESKSNIEWYKYKSYEEYNGYIILTTYSNELLLIDLDNINDSMFLDFIRKKMFSVVRVFNKKVVNKKKDLNFYLKQK